MTTILAKVTQVKLQLSVPAECDVLAEVDCVCTVQSLQRCPLDFSVTLPRRTLLAENKCAEINIIITFSTATA